ncbi:MAG: LicD family protein [Oscillospiraceae bacterium]|nr:LicD family protein [Oscillospiraceae bacterium]
MNNLNNTSTYIKQCLNALQQKELELLAQFIDICEKLQIQYFLVCGSALGSVKYQGFIPWDDDIDVALFRDDYEVFLTKAPQFLPKNMLLQNTYTDAAVPFIYSKLRNSDTTYIEKPCEGLPINHGVYIDIFPLDGYPARRLQQVWLEMRKKYYTYLLYTVLDIPRRPYARILNILLGLIGGKQRIAKVVRQYTKMISNYCTDESALICNHGNWQGKLEYASREQYGNGEWATFEGLKVRIPENYDAYLTQKYGDWRNDLPPEKQVGHHYAEVIDLNRPFIDYIIKCKNGKNRLKTSDELQKDGITVPESYRY